MANPFYTASGIPVTGSPGASAGPRGEFALIQAGFDKMPAAFTANCAVIVNSGGTGLTLTVGGLALAGNLTTTGAFNTTFVQGASVTITLPVVSGTLATLAGTEELTGKTLTSSVGKGTWTASGTWTLPAVTLGGVITYGGVALSNAVTGTGSMVLSVSPTLSGTATIANAKTSSGVTASTPTGTPVTIFAPSGASSALYKVWINISGAGLATYMSWAEVGYDPAAGTTVGRLGGNNATLSAITTSGGNIQATQTSGINQVIEWTVIRVGG